MKGYPDKETIEALVIARLAEGDVLPVEEWAVVNGVYYIYTEETDTGWKVTIPKTGAERYCKKPEDIISTGVSLKG